MLTTVAASRVCSRRSIRQAVVEHQGQQREAELAALGHDQPGTERLAHVSGDARGSRA